MAVQTSYSIDHNAAIKGMVADQQVCNAVSKLNKGASVIPYGVGVVTDGEDGGALPVPASTADEFIGVVMYEINRAQADGAVAGIPENRDGSIVTHGVIWVEALATVAKDDDVFLRVGATDTGNFSNVASSGATLGVQIPGAKFLTGGDAGDLVKISLGIGG